MMVRGMSKSFSAHEAEALRLELGDKPMVYAAAAIGLNDKAYALMRLEDHHALTGWSLVAGFGAKVAELLADDLGCFWHEQVDCPTCEGNAR